MVDLLIERVLSFPLDDKSPLDAKRGGSCVKFSVSLSSTEGMGKIRV